MRPVGTCPQAGAAPWEACSTDIDSIHGPVRCRGRCECTGCVVSIDNITNRNKQCGVLHCHCCWRRQKDGWMQQRRPIRCLQCCNGICGRTVRDRPLYLSMLFVGPHVCLKCLLQTSQSHGEKKSTYTSHTKFYRHQTDARLPRSAYTYIGCYVVGGCQGGKSTVPARDPTGSDPSCSQNRNKERFRMRGLQRE